MAVLSCQLQPAAVAATRSSPLNAERKKRWAAKVKTGCATCRPDLTKKLSRARRVKCDEAKPSCRRCVSVGRICGGYSRHAGAGAAAVEGASTSPFLRPSNLLPILPIYLHSSRQEEQMFHLLCTEATDEVAGGFDRCFWTIDIPRATRTYPAIWHASASLTAMYKRIKDGEGRSGSEQLYQFSLAQYNKAIEKLLSINPRQAEPSYHEQETLLLASILFTSVCILQGDQEKAQVHVDKGVRLFNDWRFWEHSAKAPSGDGVSVTRSLVALFTRFELSSSFTSPPKPFWRTVSFDRRQPSPGFTSATDVYYEQQQLLNNMIKVYRTQVYRHIKGLPDMLSEQRLSYRYQYRRWKAKFRNLRDLDDRARLIMQMYAYTTEVLLYADATAAESVWDRYTYSFGRIFAQAKQLFEIETSAKNVKNGCGAITLFAFSPVPCHPCLGVGALCRDGVLRRKSIDLLRRWPLRDGMVNYKVAAESLVAIMLYEESHLQGEQPCRKCERTPDTRICGSHRVIYRDMEQVGEQKGRLRMTTVDDVRHDRPGKVVDVTW
ncbi:hypothetical protein E4U43_002830 [Claviceps pusilla]|uniref:Zn(2)-C6 fungal-type domain-containing protein n=1 Tax=Claviceps pusilla TaxID=123648 RepID=A0A9P7N611_9HYPO|nr:hypothetical protein E4U43_002830 [Claviceps pusilla]